MSIIKNIINKVIRRDKGIASSHGNLMKFQAWDKKHKKFWHDFRIHPQGFVAPATKSEGGSWIYDWDYPQDRIVLITGTGIKDRKRTKRFPKGQEVWQGDRLKGYKGCIIFEAGAFNVHDNAGKCIGLGDIPLGEIEVIGNIYEK